MSCETAPSRRGCNEECLRRIAARLCRLDDCSRDETLKIHEERDFCALAKKDDECCSDVNDNPCSASTAQVSAFPAKAQCGSKDADSEDSCAGNTCCSNGQIDWNSGETKAYRAGMTAACCAPSAAVNCSINPKANNQVKSEGCCTTNRCSNAEPAADACCGDNSNGQNNAEAIAGFGCNSQKASASVQSSLCEQLAASRLTNAKPDTCSSNEICSSGSGCCSSTPADPGESDNLAADPQNAGSCNASVTESCCSNLPDPTIVQKEACKTNCCGTLGSRPKAVPITVEECVDQCCNATMAVRPAPTSSACSDHLQLAADRFEAMLKRGQCLCRRALKLLDFNCCTGTPASVTRLSPNWTPESSKEHPKMKAAVVSAETEIHSHCSYNVPKSAEPIKSISARAQQEVDVEQAAARERVVVSVAGMTCTGCSRKMMNVLTPIAGLSNPQVTFVSGSAEFDLDTTISGKAESVLLRIEKETGFKCTRIVSGRQKLDVTMSPAAARQLEEAALAGVISIAKVENNVYLVTYDPTIVGARSLVPEGAQLAPPNGHVRIAEDKRRLFETAISTALAATLTIPVAVLEWSSNPVPHRTRSIVTLVLGTCVQAIAVPEFYVGALKSLIYSRVVEMDMLVVISITAAYVYSVVAFGLEEAGIKLEQEAFFETSTLLITLVLLGRLIAAWARLRAVSAVSMRSLQAETAILVNPDGRVEKIDARLLQFGDTIAILPHSRVVTDGKVVSGESEVDESMITGESAPVPKRVGENVVAGTINGAGNMSVHLSRLPGENSITDIADLVENAVASKPRVQELADKVASWFIPFVMTVAIFVFCVWIAVAIRIRGHNGGGAVGLAITYAIAVLAISCPCALGLAVPMVLVIAGGVAARAGVIIKAADAIERGYQVTDVVFDKTGTLTEGDLQVIHAEMLSVSDTRADDVLSLAKAVVESNEHPVSVAVAAHISANSPAITMSTLDSVVSIPGAGIEARYYGGILKAGNPYWLNLQNNSAVAPLLQEAMTLFCLTLNNELVLVYGLKSTIRSNAASVIARLRTRNITCHIVSGDNAAVVADVAHILSIPPSLVCSRTSPAGKQQYVHGLQAAGKTVLFLGDGTNDAVAIAQADVGVQMGSASDVTGAVADVVLLSHNLDGIHALLDLSHAAVRRVIFNFGWSAVYNTIAILLAAGAFVKFRIPPMYAGLGEIVSVLPVIVAAGTLVLGKKMS